MNRQKCWRPWRTSIWRSRSRTRAIADFVTAGGPQLIADNACAHRFVIGPQAPAGWRQLDLAAHRVVGRIGDRPRLRRHRRQRPGRSAHRAHLARQRAVGARHHAGRRPDRDHRAPVSRRWRSHPATRWRSISGSSGGWAAASWRRDPSMMGSRSWQVLYDVASAYRPPQSSPNAERARLGLGCARTAS